MVLDEPPATTAAAAIPAGRLGMNIDTDPLLLYSLLSAQAYTVLQRDGVLRADPSKVATDFRYAYNWMRNQMHTRVASSRGDYPIWLWAKIRRIDLINAARFEARHHPGSVLVACSIPHSRCLLSNFDDWHSVLNTSPCITRDGVEPTHGPRLDELLSRIDNEYEALRAALEEAGLPWQASIDQWPASLREHVESSWELIFNTHRYRRGACWQATIDELHATDVVRAVRLIGPHNSRVQ